MQGGSRGGKGLDAEANEEGVPFRGQIREKLGRGLAGSLEVGGGRNEGRGEMARA